jgi:ABC-type nitrate/sulfonate/bicarbonate transport system permease component
VGATGEAVTAPDPLAAVVDVSRRDAGRHVGLRVLSTIAGSVLSVAVVIVAWQLVVKGLHLNPLVSKGPGDVWHYLTGPGSAANRSVVFAAGRTTLADAGYGFLAGTGAAVVSAIVFTLYRPVEQTFLPVAMALRSVPLVAMVPVLTLVFGRGLAAVMVIAGIVTFFPTLVNVSLALRAVPVASMDLLQAYGSSPRTTLLKVQVPSALPSLFASARIAAPLATVGALLAEWLATGKGLGYLMLTAGTTYDYDQVWAGVALVTVFSVVLYGIISACEQVVLARYAPDA